MEASEKASVASGKALRRIMFTFCNLLRDVRDQKRKPKPWSLPQKIFKFFATLPVPIRSSGQTFVVIGPCTAANYGL